MVARGPGSDLLGGLGEVCGVLDEGVDGILVGAVGARLRRERVGRLVVLAGEALEDLGSDYNPFLEDGETRAPDDDAAGLALAATIAGGGDDDEANPFAAEDGTNGSAEPAVNPFLEDAAELEKTPEEV